MQLKTGGRFILLLFILQIIINLLHSVSAFPFLHYGMYSASFEHKYVTVYEIWVNGKQLRANDFPVLTWDMLHIPLASQEKIAATNDFAFDKKALKTGLSKTGLAKVFNFVEANLNNSSVADSSFAAWYQSYLEKILQCPVQTLRIMKSDYSYSRDSYVLLKREPWIQRN